MQKKRSIVVLSVLMAVVLGFVLSAGATELVNINTASKAELMQLEGIGSATAEKIIEYRDANGPFKAPEDIMSVKGIGPSTYEKNKERITVGQVESN